MAVSTEAQSKPSPPAPSPALLRLEGVGRDFRMGETIVQALADVNLEIHEGEFIVILGPSGSGKSTLLNLIGGLDRPTNGCIWFRDEELTAASDRRLTDYRRQWVGFIFQFYNMIPTLTARENVQAAAELVSNPLEAEEVLRMVDLIDRQNHFPSQLSGGQQQRVAIARSLIKQPALILADEPTGALDLSMSRIVLSLLQRLNREMGVTLVLITHNAAIAQVGTRTIRVVSGRIAEDHPNKRVAEAATISW